MKKEIILSTILLLNACCFGSPDSKFYMLNSEELTSISDKYYTIAVPVVKVPEILDRPQMITYEADNNQINVLEFNRWGENLPYVLQNTLTNDLMAYLPNSYIKSTQYASEKLRYSVEVEVNNFKAIQGKNVQLSVWWSIKSSSGENIKRRQKTYETTTDNDSIEALVKAQNQVVHQLSLDIAENMIEL